MNQRNDMIAPSVPRRPQLLREATRDHQERIRDAEKAREDVYLSVPLKTANEDLSSEKRKTIGPILVDLDADRSQDREKPTTPRQGAIP